MDKKIKRIHVVSTSDKDQLTYEIENYLAVGYELHGTMQITPFVNQKSENTEILFTQIMVSYEEYVKG